jgi:N-acetylglucosaminyldiphosphoundecaprenol N-acetyl-beta-D-mannosaminyltransferase
VADANAIIQARADDSLKAVYTRAGMVTPDGMPLVWMCRWFGHAQVSRVYGPDLMRAVMADPEFRARRHYFYGGHEGVADRLAALLSAEYPGLNIAGTQCPPFVPLTDDEGQSLCADLNQSNADIIWVGLGAPKQERWMARFRPALNAPIIIGVGAAFDFLSGGKPQAPKAIRRLGFEWAFRWATEPRRLTKRYLRTIPTFAALALAQLTGLARFPMDAP